MRIKLIFILNLIAELNGKQLKHYFYLFLPF